MDMAYDDVRGPMGDTKGPRGPNTFDTFKYKVEDLATKLGLSEWLIECKHEKLEDDVKIRHRINYLERRATLTLNTSVEGHELAVHYAALGICHVLLADIDQAMEQAKVPYVARCAMQSAVIRRLARVL